MKIYLNLHLFFKVKPLNRMGNNQANNEVSQFLEMGEGEGTVG